MRISDWSSDVCSSDLKIFPMMLQKLIKTGRGHWLDEEMEKLADLSHYSVDPDNAWHRLKAPSRKPEEIGRASGRERVCQYVSLSVVAVSLKTNNKQKRETKKHTKQTQQK